MAKLTGKRQQGFTLIEMVVVLALIGLLAAVALPRLLDATDDAREKALEGMAGAFATAVSVAHAQWFVQGNSAPALVDAASKTYANLSGKIIYVNENGWPANTNTLLDSSYDNQTAEECQQVWHGILQSAPESTLQRSDREDAKYFIQAIDANPDICRYELIIKKDPDARATHYFDYQLLTGDVTIHKPQSD